MPVFSKSAEQVQYSIEKEYAYKGAHQSPISRTGWSADGNLFATASDDLTAKIWRLDGEIILEHTLKGHTGAVRSVAWFNNERLATAARDASVIIWDAKTGKEELRFSKADASLYDVSWSPDGNYVLAAARTGAVYCWNAFSGKLCWEIQAHERGANSICWIAEHDTFATSSADKTIKLWRWNAEAEPTNLASLTGHGGRISEIVTCPSRFEIASAGARHIRIWSTEKALELVALSQDSKTKAVTSVTYNRSGLLLASRTLEGFIQIYERSANDEYQRVASTTEIASENWLATIAFHPIDDLLLTPGDADCNLAVWKVSAVTSKPKPPSNVTITIPEFRSEIKLKSDPVEDSLKVNVFNDLVTVGWKGAIGVSRNNLDQLENQLSVDDHIADGNSLFNAVINDQKNKHYPNCSSEGAYSAAMFQKDDIDRVSLFLMSSQSSVHALGWESLNENGEPLSVQFPFSRTLPRVAPHGGVEKLKLLVVICNPSFDASKKVPKEFEVLAKIETTDEKKAINDALSDLVKNQYAEVDFLAGNDKDNEPTFKNLRDKLSTGHYNAIHLIAHGVQYKNQYYLVLGGSDFNQAVVSTEKFVERVKDSNLQLVVLAACESATIDIKDTMWAVAPRLVAEGIPAVVAMRDKVQIDAAQLFSYHLYQTLSRCGTIDKAVQAGRRELYRHFGRARADWTIPVLYLADGAHKLFAHRTNEVAPPMPATPLFDKRLESESSKVLESLRQQFGGATAAALSTAVTAAMSGDSFPQAKAVQYTQNCNLIADEIHAEVKLRAESLSRDSKIKLDLAIFAQIAAAINAGKHIILIGPPGTGKSSLASFIAKTAFEQGSCRKPFLTTATADWSTFDTIGGYMPTDRNGLTFHPGVCLRAISEGSWLIIDEINRADIDKAFGQLFTVLSGHPVALPFCISGEQILIEPMNTEVKLRTLNEWVTTLQPGVHRFHIHPNWRIIGTMNVYDRASLYSMSLAFKRRFAFIDIGLPGREAYLDLLKTDMNALTDEDQRILQTKMEILLGLTDDPDGNMLKTHRAFGPAIARDMVSYVVTRSSSSGSESVLKHFAEAVVQFVVPQLDGLPPLVAKQVMEFFGTKLFPDQDSVRVEVLARIRDLYPFLKLEIG